VFKGPCGRLYALCLETFGKAPILPADLDAIERDVRQQLQDMRDGCAARADEYDRTR
jgi:hypothetical protein